MFDKLSYEDLKVLADICSEKKFTAKDLNKFLDDFKRELIQRNSLWKDEQDRLQEEYENHQAFEREQRRKRQMDKNQFIFNMTKLIGIFLLVLFVVLPITCVVDDWRISSTKTVICPEMAKSVCEKDSHSKNCSDLIDNCMIK